MLLMDNWNSEIRDSSSCRFCRKQMWFDHKSWRCFSLGDVKIRVHISCYNKHKKNGGF